MAHGWDSYFHNPPPLPSDSGALRRTAEPDGHLSHHIEDFTGHHDFAGTGNLHEAPVFNSDFNTNYCSDPSVVNSRSEYVYQRYCSETPWQADGEQIGKDYLQRCGNGNIPDFATEGLQTSDSFPSSFGTDFQGLKEDYEMPSTSFLENYSDVSSCSDADGGETRPPCKFMENKSYTSPKTNSSEKHSSSAWFFTHTDNMTFPTESLCSGMSETDVILSSNAKTQENIVESAQNSLESLEKTVTSYTGHDQSSTTSYMKTTTESKTELEISDYGGFQDEKQKKDVGKKLRQAHSDLLVSGHENFGDGIDKYPDSNEEKQITSAAPSIISTFKYDQDPINENASQKEMKEPLNQENEGLDHTNSTDGQNGNVSEDVQNNSAAFKVETKESGSVENEVSDEHKSPTPNSSICHENMDTDCQKNEIQTDALKSSKAPTTETSNSNATTQELWDCTKTSHNVESSSLSKQQSDESTTQNEVCRSLDELSDTSVARLPEPCLLLKSSIKDKHFSVDEEQASAGGKSGTETSLDPECSGLGDTNDNLSVDTRDKNKQVVGIHVESCLQLKSSSIGANPHLDTELASAVEKTKMTLSPDPNCSHPFVSNEDTSRNTRDTNNSSVATHPVSFLQPQTSSTDTNHSLEMEDTSKLKRRNLTAFPDQSHSDLSITNGSLSIDTSDKNRQSVDSHSESCLQPKNLNTDTHSRPERTQTTPQEKKPSVSSPGQDCSGGSVTIDSDNFSVTGHSESSFQLKCLNTDIHPSIEMEPTSQSEKKNPTSSPDQDCSNSSATSESPAVDVTDKNKQNIAANSESSLQLEGLNTGINCSREMEIASQAEKKMPTSPPDQDCNCPSITSDSISINTRDKNRQSVSSISKSCLRTDICPSAELEITTSSPDRDCVIPSVTNDSLSIDTSDENKQSVAANPVSSPQTEISITDMHVYVEEEWISPADRTRTTSSTDPECTSHVVTSDCNKQSVSDSLESRSQPKPSTTNINSSDCTSSEMNANTTCCPDPQQLLHKSLVSQEPLSLSEDWSENARDSFEDMDFSTEDQPDMLYGEPLSRDDTSCDTNETKLQYKEAARTDGDSMDHSGGQAPQLRSAAEMRKLLQPVVVLKTLESTNGMSDTHYCAHCEHKTCSTDNLIEHYHSCHSLHNFDFCKTCNLYLLRKEQAGKHLCGGFTDRSLHPSDSSPQKKGNRFGHHRCDRCGLIFSKIMHYIKHMRTHTGKTPFRCNGCGTYFAQGGSLQRHKRIPGRCKRSKLPVENPEVSQTATPKQKDVVESDTNMLKCFVKLFDISKTNLCGLCGKSFSTAEKVKKHLYNVHHGRGTVVSLNPSPTTGSQNAENQEKIQEVENGITGKFKCPLCPRLFKYSYNRARHLRDCVRDAIYGGKEKVDGKYRCPLCHTTFTLTCNRYRHIKTNCLKEFLNRLAKEKAKLRTKVEKETVESEPKPQTKEKEQKKRVPPALTAPTSAPRYKCNLCPAVFCHASGKYRHMKKHELFKLTGKIIKYRNSVFSIKSKPETLNSTPNEENNDNLNSAEAKNSLPLSCRFCGKYFSSSQSLKKHEHNHRGERPYRCLECGKGFKKRSHLIGHKIVHQRRIQCTVCKKILPTIGELIQHRSSHLKRGTLQCPDCTMQFQHPAHLLRHLKTHKNRENKALHVEERRESKHQQSLDPVKEQVEPKQIQCSLCKEIFDDAQVLRKHCLTHISGSSTNQCPFCKRNFNNRRYLLRHMSIHTGDKPFSCPTCGKQFYRNICLKIHSQKCSPPQTRDLEPETKTRRQYPCPYCPRRFCKKDRWKNHQHAHKINSVHPCSRCGQYYGPNKMRQHQRNCEETTELSTPDSNFSKMSLQTRQDTPKMPLQSNTTNLFQFKCPYCSQRFRFRSLFLRHLVSHTGVQPYACMHCGQRYRSQTLCLQHEAFCDGINKDGPSKLKSTSAIKEPNTPAPIEAEQNPKADGETEYKCKFCTKTFMKPRYLRRHILTHNEVKPYRCKACDSCFSRYDHLKVHQTRCKGKKTRLEVRIPKISLEDVGKGWQNKFGIESAKKQETFECEVCSRSYSTQSKLSRHFTMFHATKLFKCTRCGSAFAHEKSLKKHKKMRRCRKVLREKNASLLQGTNPPTENVTGSLDRMKSQMLRRIQPCFNKKYKYVCGYCPRAFGNTWQLRVHTRLHTGEKPYSCDYCGERFIRKDYVQRHFVKCPNKPLQSTVLCDICGGFFSAGKLENHKKVCGLTTSSVSTVSQSQQSASQTPPKGFSCAYCSSRFLLFSQLQEHFLSTHKLETMTQPVSTAPLQQLLSDIKEEPVDESCDERLSDNSNLTCKLDRALNIEPPKQFFCQDCNMTFVNKAGLSGHLRTHAVGRPFNCKSCNKGFWNKSLLRNHYRKCRNGRIPNQQLETPLKANFDFALSDSAFVFGEDSKTNITGVSCKDELMDNATKNSEGNEVQSSSSKEKKTVQYQCSECEMSFTDGLVLISHLEDHGRQEQEKKRNTCVKCGRVCTSQGNLEKHMRMHATDQKYSCSDCSKLFYTMSDLEVHRTSHDPNRPYSCKLCNQRFWTRPSLCSHYREAHEDDVFSCRFCSKSYAVKKSLARHYKKWHPKQYKDLGAAVKEKGSSEQQSSSQVSTNGDSDEDENNGSEDSDSDSAPYFPCHVCGKTFPTSESLEDHQLCHLGEKPHECEQCGKCFFQSSQLQQHQRMHKSEFQCQTCGRGFVSLFALRKHKHNHGKNRSLRCSKCNIFFTGPSQLAEHMFIHREENFPCDICNRVFLSKSSRAEHWKTHSTSSDHPSPSLSRGEREQPASHSESSFRFTSEFKYRCGVCSERFRDPEELSEHGCMEAKERPYSCTDCDKHFLHASHLKKHRNTHQHSRSNHEYPCNQCNSSFASSQLFLSHLKSHIGTAAEIKREIEDEDDEPSRGFICPVCSQCFARATDLIHHFPTHPDGTIEKIKFATGSKLKEHDQRNLTSAAEYECIECKESFLGEVAFRHHNCSRQQAIKSEYSNSTTKKSSPTYFQAAGEEEEEEEEEEVDVTGDDLYNCPVCSVRFTSKNVLLEHQNKEHPNEKPFTCNLCGKTFARRRYLREHERRHRQKAQNETQSAERNFRCSQCQTKFTTAQDLSLHMRKHAEKEVGEYRCDMCYKSFSQWSLLKQHQESHVGEVVYECTECDKAFAFPHLLEEHQQTHAASSE